MISVFHDLLFQPAICPLLLMARVRPSACGSARRRSTRTRSIPSSSPARPPRSTSPRAAAPISVSSPVRGSIGSVSTRAARLQRMREAVEIVRRLLAGDRSGLRRGALHARAGRRPRTTRRCARAIPLIDRHLEAADGGAAPANVADEVKIGGCANPEMVRLMRAWIGYDDVGIVVGAVTVVDEDGDAARARAAAEVAMYLDVVGGLDPTLDLAPGGPGTARPLRDRGHSRGGRGACPTPARCGRQARRVRHAAGADDGARRRASLRPSPAAAARLVPERARGLDLGVARDERGVAAAEREQLVVACRARRSCRWSSTTIWSASRTVESRWAIAIVVRPSASRSSASCTARSVSRVERARRLVEHEDRRVAQDRRARSRSAASRRPRSGSRARRRRCRSPPAATRSGRGSARPAPPPRSPRRSRPGFAKRRFSRTVAWKRYVSCETTPTASASDAKVRSRTSMPVDRHAPALGVVEAGDEVAERRLARRRSRRRAPCVVPAGTANVDVLERPRRVGP